LGNAQSPEENLKALDIILPKQSAPIANYVTYVRTGNLIYFSDLMVAVFGEKGKHARSAVGMAALPMNMAVEIEMIVEVEN
jgi:enamine deaminase RidA (YjgF/YER057c/UK114 family)